MNLVWQEMYDWMAHSEFNASLPSRWSLVDSNDPWMYLGDIAREGKSRYRATCNCAGLPHPTKTFRSLKQAKAWVQALVLLNQ